LRNDTAVTTTTTGGAGAGLRARLGGFRGSRRRALLGLPEAVALGVAALLLVAAVFAYLFLLVPQRSRQQSLEDERANLQRLLQSQQKTLGESKDTQQRVGEILTSLNRFETDNLGQASSGTKTVIEELNRLILKNNLRISGGISYTQLQEAAPGADANQPQQRRAGGEQEQARVEQSVFPGIGVTLTVEGTYANLRRFIRDIEADNQFVVIDTVELEGVTDSGAAFASQQAQAAQAPAPVSPAPLRPGTAAAPPVAPSVVPSTTPTRGALVSLRLDMAAYFRPSNVAGQ
jgi:Tfp pilus assembly protein PilO